MTIILCNISALEFWRYDTVGARRSPVHDSVLRKNSSCFSRPTAKSIEALRKGGFSFLSEPVHVLVPDRDARFRGPRIRCHARPEHLPRNSFVKICEGVYACNPDFSFVQAAAGTSLAGEVLVGLELCGTYRRSVGDRPTAYQQLPTTSAASLASFVSKAGNMHGIAKARQALLYIADGSESPMESILVVLFCFPVRLGGYGLPMPTLNFSIPTTDPVKRATGKGSFRCDLYWPEAKLAVEYDGRAHHEGEAFASNDNSRHAGLVAMGFDTISLTRRNLRNADEFDVIARSIAKKLNRRIRPTKRDWSEQRASLRNEILPWKTTVS